MVVDGHKVCGILTEMNTEVDYINYVVIGTGINVNQTEFPEEIREIAGSLCLEAGKQFAVSMVIALGCLDFLSHYVEGVTVKWPNDVYVGERKISGILIEHRVAGAHIQSSLCGIGVNINQEQFLSDAPNPVSLFQLLGRELPLQEVLEELLECIGKRYEQIHRYAELENDFLRHMYRSTGIYDFEDERGIFRASVGGIDEYGQLILKDTDGRERVYAFKEVRYVC